MKSWEEANINLRRELWPLFMKVQYLVQEKMALEAKKKLTKEESESLEFLKAGISKIAMPILQLYELVMDEPGTIFCRYETSSGEKKSVSSTEKIMRAREIHRYLLTQFQNEHAN